MLEDIRRLCLMGDQSANRLSASASLFSRDRFCSSRFRRADRPAKNARGQSTHRSLFELSRRATRAFLAAVPIVTEQSRDRLSAAQKVHLEAVCLFLGARFGIDAPNIFFRLGFALFFMTPA